MMLLDDSVLSFCEMVVRVCIFSNTTYQQPTTRTRDKGVLSFPQDRCVSMLQPTSKQLPRPLGELLNVWLGVLVRICKVTVWLTETVKSFNDSVLQVPCCCYDNGVRPERRLKQNALQPVVVHEPAHVNHSGAERTFWRTEVIKPRLAQVIAVDVPVAARHQKRFSHLVAGKRTAQVDCDRELVHRQKQLDKLVDIVNHHLSVDKELDDMVDDLHCVWREREEDVEWQR